MALSLGGKREADLSGQDDIKRLRTEAPAPPVEDDAAADTDHPDSAPDVYDLVIEEDVLEVPDAYDLVIEEDGLEALAELEESPVEEDEVPAPPQELMDEELPQELFDDLQRALDETCEDSPDDFIAAPQGESASEQVELEEEEPPEPSLTVLEPSPKVANAVAHAAVEPVAPAPTTPAFTAPAQMAPAPTAPALTAPAPMAPAPAAPELGPSPKPRHAANGKTAGIRCERGAPGAMPGTCAGGPDTGLWRDDADGRRAELIQYGPQFVGRVYCGKCWDEFEAAVGKPLCERWPAQACRGRPGDPLWLDEEGGGAFCESCWEDFQREGLVLREPEGWTQHESRSKPGVRFWYHAATGRSQHERPQ